MTTFSLRLRFVPTRSRDLRFLKFSDGNYAGAGCSITSTTTVSTLGAPGFIACTFFFAAARLGLALAGIRFAVFPLALDVLRALPRTDDFPLRTGPNDGPYLQPPWRRGESRHLIAEFEIDAIEEASLGGVAP